MLQLLSSNVAPPLTSRDSLQYRGNPFEQPGKDITMDPEMFCAASTGKEDLLMEQSGETPLPLSRLKSEGGYSILHLAADSGHRDTVKGIILKCPCLLLAKNGKNQYPIHVAADAGHLAVVEAFVEALKTFDGSDTLSEDERERLNLYVKKDSDGNTPTHLALKGGHMKTAEYLVNKNQEASFLADKNKISPLFLAIEAGNFSLVKSMLRSNLLIYRLEGRKDLVHAALKARRTDILDLIFTPYPALANERDDEGMTCLSFAASIGFYKGVCYLLKKTPKSVYICNEDGSFPIHVAVEKDRLKVVKKILKHFPESKQLLNKQRQNILHIASCTGRFFVLFYLSTNTETSHFRSKKDVNGNTPCHLATKNRRPRSLFFLFPENMDMKNNNGLRAWDIAETNMQENYIFLERVTLMMLLFYTPSKDIWSMLTKPITRPSKPLGGNKNREYVNTLLLVAALVATVAFAAGFTIPGGFNSSAPNLGRAMLANDPKLKLFLLSDTLAMQSAVVTIATLIWAQLGDPAHVQRALSLSLPSLFFSLLCMLIAFFFGVLIAVSNVTWLVAVLSITSMIFYLAMIFILGPHVFLQIPGIPAFFGYYFVLFILLFNPIYGCEQRSAALTSQALNSDRVHSLPQESNPGA